MNWKKGTSHIGVVLSFVIFVTFLIFIFTAIEPSIKTQNSKQILLNFLELNLFDELKTTGEGLTTMTITLDWEGRTGDCAKVTSGFAHKLVDEGNELLIKDIDNNIIGYDFKSSQLLINITDAYSGILKIYSGTDIDNSRIVMESPSCEVVKAVEGFIVEETNSVSVSSANNVLFKFEDNYLAFKQELGIPDDSEFTFSFLLANGSIIEPENVVIPNTNVYATTVPLQYSDEEANLQIGFLTIKVW